MLKKDLLELCLLHLLSQGDKYGYEMLARLHAAFPDTRESVIYSLLRELCKRELTQRYQGEVSEGPARKYYRLTEAGAQRYQELLEQWRELYQALTDLGLK